MGLKLGRYAELRLSDYSMEQMTLDALDRIATALEVLASDVMEKREWYKAEQEVEQAIGEEEPIGLGAGEPRDDAWVSRERQAEDRHMRETCR